ncbi:MAG: hypothetical protein V4732_06455 [Pseudomonadota bacterium]
MAKYKAPLHLDAPLLHNDHPRPVTRRELISQGFMAGAATLVGGPLLGMFAPSAQAILTEMLEPCDIQEAGADKIPFICFDLSGGANIAGSNVLIGQRGGQLDLLSAGGYSKQGLPADMTPASSTTNFVDQSLGLAFHSGSGLLRGINAKIQATTAANINGAVIPARSENDTANNPHNPMYGIYNAGANGLLLPLVGSRNSDSGGNSMSPASMINLEVRPTKVDNRNDVTGLVDVGDLVSLMSPEETVKVMESMYHISNKKLDSAFTGLDTLNFGRDKELKDMMRCGYVKSAFMAEKFGVIADIDPAKDADMVPGIFTENEVLGGGEFAKTAAVMKLVLDKKGYAGAGTIQMGGFDYHTGDRATGEGRDERAGQCIGACLEYAARKGKPLMIYVFSDGSVFSNGMIDGSTGGLGKGVWTGDDQQTASSFFLVYNPAGRPVLVGGTSADPATLTAEQRVHQQIGYMRASGDVETASSPAANNVNLLVETVVLNYMALHNEQGQFKIRFPNSSLGSTAMLDKLIAFQPICDGTVTPTV